MTNKIFSRFNCQIDKQDLQCTPEGIDVQKTWKEMDQRKYFRTCSNRKYWNKFFVAITYIFILSFLKTTSFLQQIRKTLQTKRHFALLASKCYHKLYHLSNLLVKCNNYIYGHFSLHNFLKKEYYHLFYISSMYFHVWGLLAFKKLRVIFFLKNSLICRHFRCTICKWHFVML